MKIYLYFLTLCVVAGTPCPSYSESDSASLASPQCTSVPGVTLDSLKSRQAELLRALDATRVRAEVQGHPNKGSVLDKTDANERATEIKNQLIGLMYQMDCFRNDLRQPNDQTRGKGPLIEISTFYATNRARTDKDDPYDFFGSADTRKLTYGEVKVSIPATHSIGELELPSLWRLELNADPRRHFVLKSVAILGDTHAMEEISKSLGRSRSKSLLIFVHGFNVSFSEAALRTTQLAYDLRFPGIVLFYSWPSLGTTVGYLHDEEASQLARGPFDQLIEDVTRLGFDEIYIVAHSMGNRIVGEALANRAEEHKSIDKLKEIVLAAPDINAEIFRSELAPKLAELQNVRRTIYASSHDLALEASEVAHDFPRVGETASGVLTYPGFDTVDVSRTAPVARAYGHSYVLDSVPVLTDLEDIVVWGRSLQERTLTPIGTIPTAHWSLQ
jgi:esterase/lipase superfamily enzyme